jgi:hypothetical protein
MAVVTEFACFTVYLLQLWSLNHGSMLHAGTALDKHVIAPMMGHDCYWMHMNAGWTGGMQTNQLLNCNGQGCAGLASTPAGPAGHMHCTGALHSRQHTNIRRSAIPLPLSAGM